jgi:hypothetical protein
MPSFIAACVAAFVIAFGAYFVLDRYQVPADHSYASPTGVRI